jgi:23S rRNA G2445 N2-methylase RlmL
MARKSDFDLAAELAKPSFTPAQRDAPALVELVVAGDERAPAALVKLGEVGRAAIETRLAGSPPRADDDIGELGDAATARLVGALGLLARAGDAAARAAVLARIGDPAVRVRRAAISAAGKLAGEDLRAALIARWDAGDAPPDEQRSLVEALGKLGGDDAIARLRALDPRDDAELQRRRDRALLITDRDAKRETPSEVRTDVAPPRPVTVRLHCKPGFEPLLDAELRALGHTPANGEIVLAAPWATLYASRLWMTAGIRVALPAGEFTAAIADAIASPAVRELLAAWTRGPIRWRLGFAHGHKRAIVWRVARGVTERAPELLNDPTQTAWEVVVDGDALELVPRRAADPRFAYRVGDVPAASHPTVAAALAWVGEARPGDRVWDPFAGSGTELVERARRGPYASLLGSDVSDDALAAARGNLASAGVAATLVRADATQHAPGPIDLVVTNPPLGGRMRGDAGELLGRALPNFVRALAPGGRLVWITPAPRRTSPVAERLGLKRTQSYAVDLGGVRGQLERWDLR